MKRRDFLKLLGAVATIPVVGRAVAQMPSPHPDRMKGFDGFPWDKTEVRSVADTIYYIDPSEMPLLSLLGTGAKLKLGDFPNHKYVWLEDKLTPRS
jgi:hypothetical protein